MILSWLLLRVYEALGNCAEWQPTIIICCCGVRRIKCIQSFQQETLVEAPFPLLVIFSWVRDVMIEGAWPACTCSLLGCQWKLLDVCWLCEIKRVSGDNAMSPKKLLPCLMLPRKGQNLDEIDLTRMLHSTLSQLSNLTNRLSIALNITPITNCWISFRVHFSTLFSCTHLWIDSQNGTIERIFHYSSASLCQNAMDFGC